LGLPNRGSSGRITVPLTERGCEQAGRVARAFSQPPDLLVVSPYLRARDTAAPTRQVFPDALDGVGLDGFVFAINDVRPSLIRVDADEATYNLHILLRFELEQALIADDLLVADLPAAWNECMARDLGSVPPDDAQGCLQDIHWSGGSFGYFPTYTLGNLYAAQFFAKAQAELGDLEEQFRRGEFVPLKEWLNQKIHREGQRNRAVDLVAAVTGEPLNPAYLLRHLREKLGMLYGV
jgi:carboxypeptidase Taq